ncbi:MAG: InlB B-repeat-containing protein, partial [Holdemanella sp.]|nr:InlB B-repeat-containing protein [Holdemanella sp.]
MIKNHKKLISTVLSLFMVFSMFPFSSIQAEEHIDSELVAHVEDGTHSHEHEESIEEAPIKDLSNKISLSNTGVNQDVYIHAEEKTDAVVLNEANVCPNCNRNGTICKVCGQCCSYCAVICENCMQCKDCNEGKSYCPGCGSCEDCSLNWYEDTLCTNCGGCSHCFKLCKNQDGCVNCTEICKLCEKNCGNCMLVCPGCGICKDCIEDAGNKVCTNCGGCNDCYTLCINGDGCRNCKVTCRKCKLCKDCNECKVNCPNCGWCKDCIEKIGDIVCTNCGGCNDCNNVCINQDGCSNCTEVYEDGCKNCKMKKVTFNSCGGSDVDPIYVEIGSTFTAPDDPSKPGFIFKGWYIDEQYSAKWDFKNGTVENEMTLYALWAKLCPNCNQEGTICGNCGQCCSNCALICPNCKYCENCNADLGTEVCKYCGGCSYCYYFCKNNDGCGNCKATCPDCRLCEDCNECKVNCTICGRCKDCCDEKEIELCSNCGACSNCCYYFCINGDGCNRCKIICPDCEQCIDCNECKLNCPDCGYCKECNEENWGITVCTNCGGCDFCFSICINQDGCTNCTEVYSDGCKNCKTKKITFNSCGGSDVEPIFVEVGNTFKAPENPSKNGFIFKGWYIDEQYSAQWDFDNGTVEKDMTLYALWECDHAKNAYYVNGKDSSCTLSGYKGYYECTCNLYFEDAQCKTLIENLDTWKSKGGNGYQESHAGDNGLTKHDKIESTCTESGTKEYYECTCDKYYEDQNGKTLIENLEAWKAKGGNGYIPSHTEKAELVKQEGLEPTCIKPGYKSYYKCSCDKYYEDQNGKTLI